MDRLEEPHIQELVKLLEEDTSVDFNHSIITWTIEDIVESLAIDSMFHAPPIHLGKRFGVCNLFLIPQFNQDFIWIQAKIHQVPVDGYISYRFGFKRGNDAIWHNEHIQKFKKEFDVTISYPTLSNYFNSTTKTIVLLYEFIISSTVSKCTDTFIPVLDRNEYAICVDFYHLHKSGYLSDITLRMGETEIDAHKAILSSNSEVFRKMISEMAENENTLDLSDEGPFTMQSFLHYIYMGNIECWSKFYYPTISLCEFAEKFQVIQLKSYLQAFEIDITGKLVSKSFDFEFKIEHFNDFREADTSRRSPLFQTEFGSFHLNLSHNNSSKDLFFVNLEPLEISADFNFYLAIDISHSESKQSKSYELKTFISKESEDIIEVASFTETDLLICSTPLSLNILTLRGRYIATNHSELDSFVYRTLDKPLIEEFSGFKALVDNSLYSDIKFIAEGREFSAHKSIVGSRLQCFENLFKLDKRIKEISMDEVTAPTMESFLLYLYTGKLCNEIENLLNFLPIWNKYGNGVLGGMLFNLLTQNFNVKNVCNILSKLHSLQNTEFFDALKNASMAFLCRHFIEVESSEFWDNFIIEDERIAKIFLSVVSGAYRMQCQDNTCIAYI